MHISAPIPTFQNLPVELHKDIAQYLPPEDLRNLSFTCIRLRPVYASASWWHCTVINENDREPVTCIFSSRVASFDMFLNPDCYSWFYNDSVKQIAFSHSCLEIIAKYPDFDFSLVPQKYPALDNFAFDYYLGGLEGQDSVTLNHLFGFSTQYAFLDLCYKATGNFSMLTQLECRDCVKSLTLDWNSGMTSSEFSLPVFPKLERLVFRPPEYFAVNQYNRIMAAVALFPSLRVTETLHYINRLSSHSLSGLALLPTDLDRCEVSLVCRKLKLSLKTPERSLLELPQVTHLSVNDLKDVALLPSLASFPNTRSLMITRTAVMSPNLVFQSDISTITKLVIYSKSKRDTLSFAISLRQCPHLKALTFIPIALSYDFYSIAWSNPEVEEEVSRFYTALRRSSVTQHDSSKDIMQKLSNYESGDIAPEVLANMVCCPLASLNVVDHCSLIYIYSLWEFIFQCFQSLDSLEYLSISEFYVVGSCANFRYYLDTCKTLKQVLFAPEKRQDGEEVVSTSDLRPYINVFSNKSHVLDVQAMKHRSKILVSKHLDSRFRSYQEVAGHDRMPEICYTADNSKAPSESSFLPEDNFAGWIR